MTYRWILFDADGTLFDYDKAEAKALVKSFDEIGYPFEPRYAAAYRQINGQIWEDFEKGLITQNELRVRRFELLFEATSVEADAAVFSDLYLRFLAQGTDLIEGAEEILQVLNGKVGMVIITNGLKDVQRPRLARSTIGHYFDEVVISEEVGSAKPKSRIFDVAFERMGNPAKGEVLIVGDSLTSDIAGGINYGIDTCWFNPGGLPIPQEFEIGQSKRIGFEIGRLSQLLEILDHSPNSG
jgi:2-haloacid dehalogenase